MHTLSSVGYACSWPRHAVNMVVEKVSPTTPSRTPRPHVNSVPLTGTLEIGSVDRGTPRVSRQHQLGSGSGHVGARSGRYGHSRSPKPRIELSCLTQSSARLGKARRGRTIVADHLPLRRVGAPYSDSLRKARESFPCRVPGTAHHPPDGVPQRPHTLSVPVTGKARHSRVTASAPA